jgi:LysM repeat protein
MAFDINSNIADHSGLGVSQLNALLATTGLAGLGQAFSNAENSYNINALFMIAHAAIESAWGKSYYATARNNLFGFNAVDSDPNQASYYPTKDASINFYANFLKTYYLTPGAVYYNGTTPHGIFVKYSSSHDAEAESVVGIMNTLASEETSTAASTPAPQPAAPANIYVIKSGDNLSTIAQTHGLSLAQLLALNPQFQANPNLIYPNQVVHLGGAAPVAPQPTHTVVSGDNLYNIAQANGESLAQLEAKNPQIPNPNVIYPGQVINL